jgi:hypothetical protein
MKKVLLLFTVFTLTYLGVNAQTPYWNTTGNGGNTSSHFIGTTDGNALIFKTRNTERMRLLSDKSFLGIGISNPLATLHLHYQNSVSSPTFLELLQLTTNVSTNGFSIFSNKNTNDIRFKQQENANFVLEGPGGGLVIAPDGNVGYGTTEPKQKLHIDEGNLLITSVSSGATNAPNGALIFADVIDNNFPNGKWVVEYLNSTHPILNVKGLNFRSSEGTPISQRVYSTLFLSSDDNVGIGTIRPQAKLDVAGAFMAENADITGMLNAENATIAGTLSADALSAQTATISNLTGTTTANNLRIENLLCAKEVKVQLATCWPDYVFAKDYNLLPLSEVEQFINENQHLPNIPSAAEVGANGIELGEMNAKLLLKVEELTLYIIQMEKRLAELESKKGGE